MLNDYEKKDLDLRVNDGIMIGRQNAVSPNEFYCPGSMSAIIFYNSDLSSSEIAIISIII